MAKQEVGLKIDVDVQSVGNMKQQLRAATQELVAMNEKFGSSSKEATEAARRVARLKDAIGDAKALADTFNPDKKFVALGGAVQGAVAGFSALQGAVGLFGDKSKEVEEVLLKVQSAMALQQGISGVFGAIDSFKLLGGVIKTQVVAAFTTLRGAMMATGIGLITSAVAFLVTNFDAVKKKLGELFPALKGTGDLMDRLKQIAMGVGNAIMQFLAAPVSALIKVFQGDFKGAIDSVKNGFSFIKNFREGEKKEIESQAAEAEEARQAELEKQKAANDKKLAEQKRAAEERLKKLKEQQEKERQLREAADKVLDDARRSLLTERQREEEDALRDFENAKLVLKKAGIDNTILIEKQYRETLKNINIKYENEEKERLKKEQEEKVKKDKEIQDADIKNKEAQFASIRARAALELEIEKDKEDEKKRIAEEGSNARIMLARAVGDTLSALSDVVGRETAAGKALAIAQATINTFLGITEVWKAKSVLPEPFNTASKVAATITTAAGGFAAVRKIAQTSVPGAGGGGGGVGNLSAPVTPALAPQVVATQVNTAAVNQMGNRAARAYVLNSDIQNDNQRNAYIDRNASIG